MLEYNNNLTSAFPVLVPGELYMLCCTQVRMCIAQVPADLCKRMLWSI